MNEPDKNSEIAALEAASDALAARRADPRTAAVVRRAFLPPFCALTLRRYLALEEADSPLITHVWPWDDAAAMAQAFCTAWAILFPLREIPGVKQLSESIEEMVTEMNRGRSTVMKMRAPRTPGASTSASLSDGIGWVPRLLGRAYEAGLSDPLDLPMDQLFVIVAGAEANDGKESIGEDYSDRSLSTQQEAA